MVAEAREQDPRLSINAACKRIGPQLGIKPDTLRNWCKQADIDAGRAPGTTSAEAARITELGATQRTDGPEAFATWLAEQTEAYTRLIQSHNIRAE